MIKINLDKIAGSEKTCAHFDKVERSNVKRLHYCMFMKIPVLETPTTCTVIKTLIQRYNNYCLTFYLPKQYKIVPSGHPGAGLIWEARILLAEAVSVTSGYPQGGSRVRCC